MKERELKELKKLKLTKNIIIPFPNFQPNTIISPTQMNDNFEEIEYAYNNLIDNHNSAISKVEDSLNRSDEAIDRVQGVENDLQDSERKRILNENTRITNESARISSENIRIENENTRNSKENTRIANEAQREQQELERMSTYQTHINDEIKREEKHNQMIGTFNEKVTEVDEAIASIPTKEELKGEKGDKGDRGEQGVKGDTPSITHLETSINNKIQEVETRFNTLTSTQQQSSEVIDSRDGEVSLKARLDRDLAKGKIIEEQTEGNFITVNDSIGGYIHNVEVLGNTVQDLSNLADIKSVGELQEDGTYKMSILSCGKNLFDIDKFKDGLSVISDRGSIKLLDNGFTITATKSDCHTGGVITNVGEILDYSYRNRCVYVAGVKNIHVNYSVSSSNNSFYYAFYDCNYQLISYASASNSQSLTISVPINAQYFVPRFSVLTEGTSVTITNIQIEEGTVATPYEPYQENKCDILLPCQLEKVGTVSDRLFRREDGVWCIEKNIKTDLLCGANNEDFRLNKTLAKGGYQFTWSTNMGAIANKNSEVISSTMKSYVSSNEDYSSNIWIYDGATYVIHHPTISTADEIKLWLQTNPTIVKFPTNMPQFIPLPRNTQIALNSFFGTTHIYMESGEVEGTIKCKIPKSLGATVQSLNNKTDILSDRIEAIEGLKDSQNMKYETDKGYLVCKETKNGVIEDVKLEGKTLVNLSTYNNIGETDTIIYAVTIDKNLVSNATFTVINYSIPTFRIEIKPIAGGVGIKGYSTTNGVLLVDNVAQENYIANICVNKSDGYSLSDGDKLLKSIILEGDHTQNPPSYFEGLMSVGEDVDEIEVLSSNNLLEEDENYKQDKKQILFYNENGELEPVTELHEWDSIEKHSDNKWYYHKRSGKVVLNGSNFALYNEGTSISNKKRWVIYNNSSVANVSSSSKLVISDKYNTISADDTWYVRGEGIAQNSMDNKIYLYLEKYSDGTEISKSALISELQANNVTVVYQLAEEEVYELAPLHLDSYANETLILCNSGAISPKMEFSITSHINELIKSQGDRISLLEEKMYKALKQVLAGDMYSLAELLYPEDFVSKEEPIDVPTLLI